MAKLLLIAAGTERPGYKEIGDVIDIREDDHEFGPATSPPSFRILSVPGTVAQVRATLASLVPDDLTNDEISQMKGSEFRLTNEGAASLKGKFTSKAGTVKAARI